MIKIIIFSTAAVLIATVFMAALGIILKIIGVQDDE